MILYLLYLGLWTMWLLAHINLMSNEVQTGNHGNMIAVGEGTMYGYILTLFFGSAFIFVAIMKASFKKDKKYYQRLCICIAVPLAIMIFTN